MYKILIVDDEVLARVGIKSLLPWHDLGYDIYECENGEKALALAQELSPDIIITDMKMPVMNGVELIKAAKEKDLPAKFIVLSAFDDFNLVKESMRLGAEDYMRKLELEADTLMKTLESVCEKIESERVEKDIQLTKEKQITDNMQTLKLGFLRELIRGKWTDRDEIDQQLELHDLEIADDSSIVILLEVQKKENNMAASNGGSMYEETLRGIIDEIVQNHKGFGTVFFMESNELAIIESKKNAGEDELLRLSKRISQDIVEYVKDALNVDLFVSIGSVCGKVEDISQSYKTAKGLLEKKFAFPKNGIVTMEDMEASLGLNGQIPMENELKELETALKNCNFKKIETAFESITEKLRKAGLTSRKSINGICQIIIFEANLFIKENGFKPEELWGKENDPFQEVGSMTVMDEYLEWIGRIKASLVGLAKEIGDSRAIILKAKQYVGENFRTAISLDDIANYLGLSSSYFSRLFSEEVGDGFVAYLTDIRIEKAKELLSQTNLKVYEISYMVGYDNPNYFSRVFKKETGLSPYEFRSHKGGTV